VAELEDALDLGSSGETHAGSSPALRTIFILGKEQKMEYKIKEQSKTKIVFEASNTKEEIESAKRDAYKKLISKVRVPGFRQGKAPYDIGAPFVGEGRLLEEAVDFLLQKDLDEFIAKEKVNPVVRPEVKIDKITEDSLTCTITVEFLPEVTADIPEKIEILFKHKDIDKEVENKIKDLQKTFTEITPVDREIKEGDLVELQYKIEGVKNADWKDATVEAGKKQFVGNFDEKVIGKKKGDEFQINSENMIVQVKIIGVKEKKVPPVNDDLAKDAGFESLNDMKKKIKEEALKNRELQAEEEKGNNALNKLAESLDIELPEKLINEETENRIKDIENQYIKHGIKLGDLLKAENKSMDEFKEDVKKGVIKDIKKDLLIRAIVKQNGITVNDNEIQKEFERFLDEQGVDKKKAKLSENVKNIIEDQLLRSKAISFLKERAIIKKEGDD
jgi:trigger factor